VPRPRRRNPWASTGEVLIWVLFAALLFPAGFAGWAVGHYTSLGKPSATVVHTVTVGSSSSATTTSPATTTSTTSASGNVAAGKTVFASNSCATCHTFTPAGANGTIGPNLDTQPAVDAKLTHLSVAAFLKRCITDPYAYIPKGYHSGLMPTTFGKSLSSSQLNDLVAFILSGTKS
jgi:mono/diheme cytochrome c family protein